MSIVTRSLGWLFWMSVKAPWMPSLAGSIEMSVVTPGKIPVSDMYWIMVMGPNQKRCRGRLGQSEVLMKVNVCKLAVAVAVVCLNPPGAAMVTVGADEYPVPGLVRVTPVTTPLPLTVAVPVAVVPLEG